MIHYIEIDFRSDLTMYTFCHATSLEIAAACNDAEYLASVPVDQLGVTEITLLVHFNPDVEQSAWEIAKYFNQAGGRSLVTVKTRDQPDQDDWECLIERWDRTTLIKVLGA